MTDLGTLPGYRYSEGHAINNAGQVTGYLFNFDRRLPDRAFLYSDGQMRDLGTLDLGGFSGGAAINDAGQVVGYSNGHAFLYSNGQMTDLGTLGGASVLASASTTPDR
jgi:probable HAF family extracellular repeat protein